VTAKPSIAIVGGTGLLGSGLARRLAVAGYSLLIGSRTADKAEAAAAQLVAAGGAARGATNADAAKGAEVVIVTVPWQSQAAIIEEIRPHVAGKLVIDTTVPLVPPKVARVQLPAEQSAALAAQQRLGAGVRVAAAFHTVAAHKLQHKLQRDEPIEADVLVFGDDAKDREIVIGLVQAIKLRGIHAGPLVNAVAAEALTSVLIGINRAYKVDGAGIRITGIGGA
jgi:8-hydroxy-5-deazaflavin:NADPH oxidoreductase